MASHGSISDVSLSTSPAPPTPGPVARFDTRFSSGLAAPSTGRAAGAKSGVGGGGLGGVGGSGTSYLGSLATDPSALLSPLGHSGGEGGGGGVGGGAMERLDTTMSTDSSGGGGGGGATRRRGPPVNVRGQTSTSWKCLQGKVASSVAVAH